MATREIWHEVLVNASPAELYQAVTEVPKLAHWWTTDVRGESVIARRLEFLVQWISRLSNGGGGGHTQAR
jgi:uncharacterized protein YndB with AHSA1/START domain